MVPAAAVLPVTGGYDSISCVLFRGDRRFLRDRRKIQGGDVKARVYVTYRRGILDPQGDAVARSLAGLGFDDVSGVRIGK